MPSLHSLSLDVSVFFLGAVLIFFCNDDSSFLRALICCGLTVIADVELVDGLESVCVAGVMGSDDETLLRAGAFFLAKASSIFVLCGELVTRIADPLLADVEA